MSVPEGLFYTKEHEWIKIEGKIGTIGITDHAQVALGDITFIELPTVGKSFKQTDPISTVESVKAASDIFAPMSGKVIKVNDALGKTPEIVNQSPYEKGWIACIEISNEKEKDTLMNSGAYSEYLKEAH
ncbi:MAG: glycine cleavage system protein GcvH [Candidatus Omnitrophota bacterium]|jgi:glycine cleavage system H protein